ncbi:MAG: ATP synthase F0 subunit B [Acidobacteria bacterium]|nr:ATP synthase F0 subunit B [Acidobacteriota bacterium]MBV9475841.1 ATP synthase F0 subunit B [Acidobacteriota bacterium]
MQINLTPDLSLLAIMVIFLINYLIVRKFFLEPVNAVLEARETETKTAESLYEDALARYNEATSRMETQLHAARRDASDVRDRFRREASAFRQQTVERTNGQAKEIITAAEAKLSGDVAAAREQIVRESESLARLTAERILGRAV